MGTGPIHMHGWLWSMCLSVDARIVMEWPMPNSVKSEIELELYKKPPKKDVLCHMCLSELCSFGNSGNKRSLDI